MFATLLPKQFKEKFGVTISILTFRLIWLAILLSAATLCLSVFYSYLFIVWYFVFSSRVFDTTGYYFVNVRGRTDNLKEWKPEPPILCNQGYRVIAFWASIFMLIIPSLCAELAYYGWQNTLFTIGSLIVLYFTGANETVYYFFFQIPPDKDLDHCNYTIARLFFKKLTPTILIIETLVGMLIVIISSIYWVLK